MNARDELIDFIVDLLHKAGVLDSLMDDEQATPVHRKVDGLLNAASAEERAEVLNEAADAIDASSETCKCDDCEVSRLNAAKLRAMAPAPAAVPVPDETAGNETTSPCHVNVTGHRMVNGHCLYCAKSEAEVQS